MSRSGYEVESVPLERSMPAAPESSRGVDNKACTDRTAFLRMLPQLFAFQDGMSETQIRYYCVRQWYAQVSRDMHVRRTCVQPMA
jgi:hypothetical protein